MKRSFISLSVLLLVVSPLINWHALAQTPEQIEEAKSNNPYYRPMDEGFDPEIEAPYSTKTDIERDQDDLGGSLTNIDDILNDLQAAYGVRKKDAEATDQSAADTPPDTSARTGTTKTYGLSLPSFSGINGGGSSDQPATSQFTPGILDALKLKPTDRKRLIKLANGSMTPRQQQKVAYDSRMLELLDRLVTPKELGGGGLEHLRVGTLLDFKANPKSRETENSDNVSAHQNGRAADIIEINKTYCVKKTGGLFGVGGSTEKLPEFPVKVIWQGGAPRNPTSEQLGAFDSIARANALRDILGTIPDENGQYGLFRGYQDLLQQIQRRVITDQVGVSRSSLDYPVNNDVLETLGRTLFAQGLGLSATALRGNTAESLTQSIALAPIEQALSLAPGELVGDDWNAALERVGRYEVALQNGLDPSVILGGQVNNLPYYAAYQRAEAAFDLPAGTLAGVKANHPDAFRQIGAQKIARLLHYSPQELTDLIAQAKVGKVTQLSLARFGDIPGLASNNALLIFAPKADSPNNSKKAGEQFIANQLLGQQASHSANTLDESVADPLADQYHGLTGIFTLGDIVTNVMKNPPSSDFYRKIGAKALEKVFDFPATSLTQAIDKYKQPTVYQFGSIAGPMYLDQELQDGMSDQEVSLIPEKEQASTKVQTLQQLMRQKKYPAIFDVRLTLTPGTTQKLFSGGMSFADYQQAVGKAYVEYTFDETFHDFYHTSGFGLAKLSLEDEFSLVLGKVNSASTRAGASWVEEDLGLAPDTFSVFFAQAAGDERLVNAGVNVLAGNLYESFEIDATNIQDLTTLQNRIAQAKIETSLGLKPGSFTGSAQKVKDANPRFNLIYASPETVDAILGLAKGTSDGFVKGSGNPQAVITKVGANLKLGDINVRELHHTLGWDDRFALIQANQSGGGFGLSLGGGSNDTTSPVPLSKFNGAQLRQLLAKIGGYNTDFAFGYDPGVTAKWVAASTVQDQNQVLLQAGASLYAQRLGFGAGDAGSLLDAFVTGNSRQKVLDTFVKLTGIPDPQDAAGLVDGNVNQALSSAVAAYLSKNNQVSEFGSSPYDLYYALTNFSTKDSGLQSTLAKAARDRFTRRQGDGQSSGSLADILLANVTHGMLNSKGEFLPDASPYSAGTKSQIEDSFLSLQEARTSLFYGAIDAVIRDKSSGLPTDFSKYLLESNRSDRASMMFDFLGTKLNNDSLNGLPTDLQSTVKSFFSSRSSSLGSQLAGNSQYADWATKLFNGFSDTSISPQGIQLATLLASGNAAGPLGQNPGALFDLSPNSMAGLINKQMGLDTGVFGSFFGQYQNYQNTFSQFKSGSLDSAQALAAADSALFGGQIAQFTSSLDHKLGLPDGSTQLLVQYAITGNPVYLAQLGQNLLFGSTIQCPDLQKEAQKNIKKLISAVLDLGEDSARFVPSQIITLNTDYVKGLEDKVKQNYFVCEGDKSRCGIFADRNYVKQVHIGF